MLVNLLLLIVNCQTTKESVKKTLDNTSFTRLFSSCGPKSKMIIRAIFHDATSRSLSMGNLHGLDASIQYELDVRDNYLFKPVIEDLKQFKTETMSLADTIALASVLAIDSCKGPHIEFSFGRIDAKKAGPKGLLPSMGFSYDEQLERFSDMGLTADEMVVLIAGGHSVASSIDDIDFDATPDVLDNVYPKEMLLNSPPGPRFRFRSDLDIASSILGSQLFKRYADSQEFMNFSFKLAIEKMLNIGWDNLTVYHD